MGGVGVGGEGDVSVELNGKSWAGILSSSGPCLVGMVLTGPSSLMDTPQKLMPGGHLI